MLFDSLAAILIVILTDPIVLMSLFLLLFGNRVYRLILSSLHRRSNRKTPKHKLAKPPRVSIIVPFYDEASQLPTKISNLASVDYPRDLLEVIFVDDGSTDDSLVLVRDTLLKTDFPFSWKTVTVPHKGPANALAAGSWRAKGDFILWTDADVTFHKSAIGYAVSLFNDLSIGAVCGRTVPLEGTTYRSLELASRDVVRSLESRVDSIVHSNGTFFVFRGMYRGLIRTEAINYDSHLAIAIREAGKRVVFDANIVTRHPECINLRTQIRRKKRIFVGILDELSHHRQLLFNRKQGIFGLLILPYSLLYEALKPVIFWIFFTRLVFLVATNIPLWDILVTLLIVMFVWTMVLILPLKTSRIAKEITSRALVLAVCLFAYFEFLWQKMHPGKWKYEKGRLSLI